MVARVNRRRSGDRGSRPALEGVDFQLREGPVEEVRVDAARDTRDPAVLGVLPELPGPKQFPVELLAACRILSAHVFLLPSLKPVQTDLLLNHLFRRVL